MSGSAVEALLGDRARGQVSGGPSDPMPPPPPIRSMSREDSCPSAADNNEYNRNANGARIREIHSNLIRRDAKVALIGLKFSLFCMALSYIFLSS